MPKRKIDPTTGQSQLTYREQQLINEYINNGGNGAQAAAAAGYKAARLDQAAYQALHRECVQRHIRERIRESRVCSDEIVGTLVSHMRGNLTEFFDESGNFSIEIAKQKGLGHLIKSISGTICDPPEPEDSDNHGQPEDALSAEGSIYAEHVENPRHPGHTEPEPTNVQTCKHCGGRSPKRSNLPTRKRRTGRPPRYRIQLHSPLQAASILARLIGIDNHHPYRPLNQPSTCNLQPATKLDFDPNALLQSLIEEQMKEHGLSREAVTNRILQVRPEFAKYLDELPPPPSLLDQLSLRDTRKLLGVITDAIAFLKSNVSNATGDDRVFDAYHQIDAAISYLTDRPGQPPSTHNPNREADLTAAIDRIISRLSEQEREHLARLQIESLTSQSAAIRTHTDPHGFDSTNQLPPGHPDTADCTPTVDSHVSDSLSSCQSETHLSPETHPCDQNAATAPPAPTTPPSAPLAQDHSATLQPAQPQQSAATRAPSADQPATCNSQPATSALESFNRTYSGITRPFQVGLLDNHFTEVIDRIMRDQSLPPQQAIDAIWLAARQSTWSSANLIDQCIADYAALHPRLAHAQPPVCARRPPSPPRYWRPPSPITSPTPDLGTAFPTGDSDDPNDPGDSNYSNNTGILTSTQLFKPVIRPRPAPTRTSPLRAVVPSIADDD